MFQAEAEQLRSTVAVNTEATINLAPGVELEQVFNRSFQKRGRHVVVPLGNFAQGETKTVLLKVRVPSRNEGASAVADVGLSSRYGEEGRRALHREARRDGDARREQGVALERRGGGAAATHKTAAVLLQANELAEKGKLDEAKARLTTRQQELEVSAARAKRAAPSRRSGDVEDDFKGQSSSISEANSNMNKGGPQKPAAAVRRNQEMANPFMK